MTNSEYLDGFQYVTRSAEIAQAFKSTDDTTLSAKTAGQEETFVSRDAAAVPQPQTTMVLSFFPTAEGFYDVENSKYIWQYKDHLGNVRLSYSQDSAGALEIVDRNDFYPFGMNFVGYYSVFDAHGSLYNYKMQGQELQETGFYDFGARMFMPDLGRWFNVDPLAEKYRMWSPYNYVMNNPLRFIDPDGRSVETVKPTNEASLKAIQNTLPKEDREFVKFDKAGNIDKEILNSHKSASGNYSNLKELVNSETIIEYTVGSSVSYNDSKGNFRTDEASPVYNDPDYGGSMHIRTGEASDLLGVTLAPSHDKRTTAAVKTSTNNNLQVYTNGNLSVEGQAQNASHELIGGHALFYVRGKPWVHQPNGTKIEGERVIRIEGNTDLKESIKKSIDETINNMK